VDMQPFLFYASMITASLGWGCLIAAPKSKFTEWMIETKIVHGLICFFYALALFTARGIPDDAGFFSLSGVWSLFKSEHAVIAAWLHIIVFDFFVGAWIVEDAGNRGLKQMVITGLLLVTIMFGPLGLLLYLVLRASKNAKQKSV
jgi:hypothetical protein